MPGMASLSFFPDGMDVELFAAEAAAFNAIFVVFKRQIVLERSHSFLF